MRTVILVIISIFITGYSYSQDLADKVLFSYSKEYNMYINGRFSFKILVPVGYRADPPPDNNDGRRFRSADNKVVLAAWGSNSLGHSINDEYLSTKNYKLQENAKITYEVCKNNWYVISGISGNDIFYRKGIYVEEDSKFIEFEIEYDKEIKKAMDKIVTDISKSFKALTPTKPKE